MACLLDMTTPTLVTACTALPPRGPQSAWGGPAPTESCHGYPVPAAGFPGLPAYAELHCRTNFSFQVGASHAEELVARAHALGYSALAITDECSVAGLVRAHAEAKKLGLKLLAGSEFVLGRR